MQTREQFLTTGLVPVLAKTTTSDECVICACPFTDPVRTPCNHVYDRDCLEHWLKTKHNTCPLCKAQLFELPAHETVRPPNLRQQQIGQALQACNVVSQQPPFNAFGQEDWTISALQRNVAMACHALGHGPVPGAGDWVHTEAPGVLERVAGPCLVDRSALLPAFLAMGNIIPALAAVEGRPISMDAWQVVCSALLPEITLLSGRKTDALILPSLLKQKTEHALSRRAGADLSWFQDGEKGRWFDVLLNFLTFRAWQLHQQTEKRRAAARAAARANERSERQTNRSSKTERKCVLM